VIVISSYVVENLEALKKQLNDGKIIQHDKEAHLFNTRCTFHEPTTQQQIDDFKKRTNWKLPKPYEEFLLYTNGAHLFRDEYGSGFHVLALDEIEICHHDYLLPNWIPIISYVTTGDYIYIDSDQVESGGNYLMWHNHEHYYDEPSLRFTIDFSTFLERLIITRGCSFWEWKN